MGRYGSPAPTPTPPQGPAPALPAHRVHHPAASTRAGTWGRPELPALRQSEPQSPQTYTSNARFRGLSWRKLLEEQKKYRNPCIYKFFSQPRMCPKHKNTNTCNIEEL